MVSIGVVTAIPGPDKAPEPDPSPSPLPDPLLVPSLVPLLVPLPFTTLGVFNGDELDPSPVTVETTGEAVPGKLRGGATTVLAEGAVTEEIGRASC